MNYDQQTDNDKNCTHSRTNGLCVFGKCFSIVQRILKAATNVEANYKKTHRNSPIEWLYRRIRLNAQCGEILSSDFENLPFWWFFEFWCFLSGAFHCVLDLSPLQTNFNWFKTLLNFDIGSRGHVCNRAISWILSIRQWINCDIVFRSAPSS